MNTEITVVPELRAVVQEYSLGGECSEEPHFYHVQSKIVAHAEDGTRKGVDTYKLRLMCEPGDRSAGEADKYTCAMFALQRDGGPEITIPTLKGWSYDFNRKSLNEVDLDEQGQLFGIPHAKFEGLTDNTGTTLPPEVGYQVYSAFSYFHSYSSLAEKGIQSLKRIGDRVLESALPETPMAWGTWVKEGSTFKHGLLTLEFKGLSVVDKAPCAIVGFDSGECSFTMIITPMPNIEVKTVGGSHYHGDIYVDLASKWMKKVTKILVDITKTTMGDQVVDRSVIETTLTIKAVEKAEFDQN